NLSTLQEQPYRDTVDGLCAIAGTSDPISASCPGTPSAIHSKLVSCSSPGATLKRPTALSRHASAAGFPMQTAGAWGFNKGHARAASAYSPTVETPEGAAIEVEDIPPLLRDVARFAEAVEKLKDVVLGEDNGESRRGLAHECLGEVLRVLRQVINTYPLLNTVETLTAAGTLISKVKGFHYESSHGPEKKDFEKAIETIAVAFSSSVSELLMGEVDSSTLLSLPPTEKMKEKNLISVTGFVITTLCVCVTLAMRVEQVDVLLQRSEGGVDSALPVRIPQMPLFSIYSLALEQDLEQSLGVQQATGSMHTQSFIQPLLQRKQEHEKKRRDIKEQWQRAKRKLVEAESNLRRAKQAYLVRCEEYEKVRTVVNKVEESTKTLDRKKRHEEEARNKAEEAEATYRTCIADATTQQQELEDIKVKMLRQIQELIRQTDQTLRSCTISYYQIMHMQTAALPVHYQTLCESCKLYDPGQQYTAHIRNLSLSYESPSQYEFEPYTGSNQGHQSHKSWPSTLSDTDGESPTTSTVDITKAPRPVSAGTLSSNDDPDERDGNMVSFEQSMNGIEPDIPVPTGPFRNVGLSKAAKTHRLRKLRTPSKCRECDSYVYFQGAECEECFLACHKKCLESLAIQCGHKKLQGRLQLFGRDFSSVQQGSSDGIPFIIKKCIQEIEKRALKMKGIYRVNGVKTRVEKLCQAFENGKDLVELSQASPHDISNVLKLYLRQLPEPIMPFCLYNNLMGLAKESLQSVSPDGAQVGKGPELVDRGPETMPEVLTLVEKLRTLLQELPLANIATLRYITGHLCKVADLEQDNKMSPSNLGIVFGPTLMRPKPTGATVSLSSLVDYPHQARIVEALIIFHKQIFQQGSGSTLMSSYSYMPQSQLQVSTVFLHFLQILLFSNSLGSSGSRERSLDSDSEFEEVGKGPKLRHPLVSQESETSTEDDQLSPRASMDLSALVPETIHEQPSYNKADPYEETDTEITPTGHECGTSGTKAEQDSAE
uniref:Rho GTPase activating protein 45b n=1 Tax=Denticeps clupeoides TaxID=299321 RepID=A0AAY4EJE3_9TELE